MNYDLQVFGTGFNFVQLTLSTYKTKKKENHSRLNLSHHQCTRPWMEDKINCMREDDEDNRNKRVTMCKLKDVNKRQSSAQHQVQICWHCEVIVSLLIQFINYYCFAFISSQFCLLSRSHRMLFTNCVASFLLIPYTTLIWQLLMNMRCNVFDWVR